MLKMSISCPASGQTHYKKLSLAFWQFLARPVTNKWQIFMPSSRQARKK